MIPTMNSQTGAATRDITYSVVLPVYNERENLEPLIHEIFRALSDTEKSFEIICVDDHSTDGSLDCLKSIIASRPNVMVIEHMKNLGQSAALVSGIASARGEIIVTMDSDGQNNPSDLPQLLRALEPGIAAVCGVRQHRKETLVRRASSRIANAVRNFITGDHVMDAGCNFRVMRKSALAELPTFNGLHRFIPSLLRYQGYKVIEIPISHRARSWGDSKYGVHNRLWRGLYDCLAMRWWKKRALPANRIRHD